VRGVNVEALSYSLVSAEMLLVDPEQLLLFLGGLERLEDLCTYA
jgi:hypothetical protein